MNRFTTWLTATVVCVAPALTGAQTQEIRVPLRDGKLSMPQLTAALSEKLGLPAIEYGTLAIDMRGIGRSVVVAALNKSLGEGCQVSVDQQALLIRYDTDKLPHNVLQAKRATRTFTAAVDPHAAAAQAAKFGLQLPDPLVPGRRTVLLLHGVDCTRECLSPLAELLRRDGYQVAFFGYPNDQSIADSARIFTEQLTALRTARPALPLDIVAFSMGSLVARSCVEGDAYPGGVGRLILLAPPNHGSAWAHARVVLEIRDQWDQWRHDPNWKLSWMITDGLGEAGGDLLPGSAFLKALNDRPRRDGVKYTIINGNLHPVWKTTSRVADAAVCLLGPNVSGLLKADQLADKIRNHPSKSDGPVSLESTKLPGVSDVVTLRSDHNGLYQPQGDQPPVAWATIQDRLKD